MAGSITAKDVALRAEVSVGTVSRVFNNHSNVSEEIRQRVLKVAADLGYFRAGGRLAAARPDNRGLKEVGFLYSSSIEETPATMNPYWAPIFYGVESESRKANIKVTYRTITDILHTPHLLITTIYEMRPGGILLVGQVDADAIGAIQATGTPIVQVDNYVSDLAQPVDTILPDNFQGARIAINFLFAEGHRRIAFIGGPSAEGPRPLYKIYSIEQRWVSYCMAYLDRGLAIPYELVENGSLSLESGYEAGKRLLERRRDFSAIFCADDLTAIGAMKALREAGLRVPEDISLIGFDGIDLGKHIIPALTTIRVNTEDLGAIALRTLAARAAHPGMPYVTTLLGAELVKRDSVAAPKTR
ncbi:MAG: LacI family DNA-binding transcriptional regulator [Ktedonobacteraceae bacterium]|nr:LacI family DNA-binding transcriptional regulator [Ktedonobacteraceae bacterium]